MSSPRRPVGSFDASVSSTGPNSGSPSRLYRLREYATPERTSQHNPGSATLERQTHDPSSSLESDREPRFLEQERNGSPRQSRPKHLPQAGGFLLGIKKRRAAQDSIPAGRFSPDRAFDGFARPRSGASYNSWQDGLAAEPRTGSSESPRPTSGSFPSAKGKDRVSSNYSVAGSSASRRHGAWMPDASERESNQNNSNRSSMDAQQLVRMALSLNESRRLRLDPGHLVVTSGANTTQRAASGGNQHVQSMLPRPSTGAKPQDFSLEQPAEAHGRQPRFNSRKVSAPAGFQAEGSQSMLMPFFSDYEYKVSAASQTRAEKAKAYIELAHLYIRLLDSLPPLRPGLSGSHRNENPRGRTYNPLQNIRNRRARNRRREALDFERWKDVEKVKEWITVVEDEAQRPNFMQGDVVLLPPWDSPGVSNGKNSEHNDDPQQAVANTSKRKRQAIDWIIDRAELLADAYWLELDNNKSLIESCDGRKIFARLVRLPAGSQDEERSDDMESLDDNFAAVTASPPSPELKAKKRDLRSDTESIGNDPTSPPRSGPLGFKRPRRHLLGRARGHATPSSDESASDREEPHQNGRRLKKGHVPENTAPLERHMTKLMEVDAQKRERSSVPRLSSFDSSKPSDRRMGISERSHVPEHRAESLDRWQASDDALSAKDSDEEAGQLPSSAKISTEDFASTAPSRKASISKQTQMPLSRQKHHHLPKFGFPRRHRAGAGAEQVKSEDEADTGKRDAHVEHGKPFDHSTQATAKLADREETKTKALSHAPVENVPKLETSRKPDQDTAHRYLFKGSRIGETAKKMMPVPSDRLLKDRKSWVESAISSRSRLASDASEDGSAADEARTNKKGRFSIDHLRPPMIATRSRSATDVNRRGREGQYHHPNLPTFTSQAGGKKRSDSPVKRLQLFEQPGISTPSPKRRVDQLQDEMRQGTQSENVSPSASVSDLQLLPPSQADSRRTITSSPKPNFKQLRESSYFPLPKAQDRGRRGTMRPDDAMNGDVSPRRTSLSPSDPTPQWSIASDRRASSLHRRRSTYAPGLIVSAVDIAYTRALLLSCGTKASAILARANSKRVPPSAFLSRAGQATKQKIEPAARKEEHVIAARLLSQHLESTVSSFETAAHQFELKTAAGLSERISDLRDLVGSQLTNRVRAGCDDADTFVAELTQNRTLAVKTVNDSVDEMLRSRRRRLRWLSRAGFASLEWVLVGAMWGIWAFVLVVRVVFGAFKALWAVIAWLLWIK